MWSFHQLRDLQLTEVSRIVENNKYQLMLVEYKCKTCQKQVRLTITLQEYRELKNGLPFTFVFGRNVRLHLKKGICESCLAAQTQQP